MTPEKVYGCPEFQNVGIWKKVGKNMSYEKNLTAFPVFMIIALEAF